MLTDTPRFVCVRCAVTCFSPSNNIYLKYLIVSTYWHKVSPIFSPLFWYYDKVTNRNQNPKIKIRPIFLYLLNKEPPTMTHKELQQSTATGMVWAAILWLVLERCGSMQVKILDGIFKVLRKSDDSFLVISNKIWVKWNWLFFLVAKLKNDSSTEWTRICFRVLRPSHGSFFSLITLWNNVNWVHTDL